MKEVMLSISNHPDKASREIWCFGVAELQDLYPSAGAPKGRACTYGRTAPGHGDTWVRHSRHFALGGDRQASPPCRTYVRDRWELEATGLDAAAQAPQHRIPYDYEGDLPTFALDPQTRALIPVPGQLTRWLNWGDAGAANQDQPPDLHSMSPGGSRWVGLLGGSEAPAGKHEEKILGPITYDRAKGEVTMEVSIGPAPKPSREGRVPTGYTGPIPVTDRSSAILAQQNAQFSPK